MNDHTVAIDNSSDYNLDENNNIGPPLYTRIAFASAWVFIAVAGIIGKKKIFFFLEILSRIFF